MRVNKNHGRTSERNALGMFVLVKLKPGYGRGQDRCAGLCNEVQANQIDGKDSN